MALTSEYSCIGWGSVSANCYVIVHSEPQNPMLTLCPTHRYLQTTCSHPEDVLCVLWEHIRSWVGYDKLLMWQTICHINICQTILHLCCIRPLVHPVHLSQHRESISSVVIFLCYTWRCHDLGIFYIQSMRSAIVSVLPDPESLPTPRPSDF